MAKVFSDVPVKSKEEAQKKIIELRENNDYTTDNLLGYKYFSKHYRVIAIGLSKQIELDNRENIKQQVSFTGTLEDDTVFHH